MPTTILREPNGAEKGPLELPETLFGGKIHRHVMWLAVKTYLTNQRQGTVQTKGRKDVSGGGVKPWRQKGTGRARSGTIRSPIWVGGGRAHGPKPRDYHDDLPKKVRQLAFRSALSVRAKEGKLIVITDCGTKEGKTRELITTLKSLGVAGTKCLVIVDGQDAAAVRAARNVPWIQTSSAQQVNTYDVLRSENVVLTQAALSALQEVRS